MNYVLNVNGQRRSVVADPSTPLLSVLREGLKITGAKVGCGVGACGGCTVSVGGISTRACQLPVATVGDRRIVTLAEAPARCG